MASASPRVTLSRMTQVPNYAVLAIAVTCVSLACADAPTPPHQDAPPVAQVDAARRVADPLISDATSRLTTAMQDHAIRDRARVLLDRLSNALDRGDGVKARITITQIRRLIASRSHAADAADFAALGLAIDQVEATLADTAKTTR